jgi:hypothetical protein
VGWSATLRRKRVLIFTGFALSAVVALGVGLGTVAGAYPATLTSAAQKFETAVASGGTGFRFDVVQRQTEDQKPGGSPIPLVDPANPTQITGGTDHIYVNTVLARGQVAPGAFWMEMRWGPETEAAPVSFESASFMWAVLYRAPNLYRNDGYGWYPIQLQGSPGIGLDPITAAKLPLALRNLSAITDLGMATLGGVAVHHFAASVDVANFPGVVAADGAAFTETPFPLDLWVDSSNRLVQLEARARNLNEPNFLLKVDTLMTFTYTAADPVPAALPTVIPNAPPQP